MKKFVNPLPAGGAPLFATESLSEILTKETYDAMEALLLSLSASDYVDSAFATQNFVVSGGAISPNGGNWDVQAGIAYFPEDGGVLARFAGATNIADIGGVLYIELEDAVIEQKTFFDSVLKDYTETRTATVVSTPTGGKSIIAGFTAQAQFISLDYMLKERFGDYMKSNWRFVEIGAWNMNTTLSVSVPVGALGVDISQAMLITATILSDSDSRRYPIDFTTVATNTVEGSIYISGTNAILTIPSGGLFNTDAQFSGTGASRGYIGITGKAF